MKPAKAAASEAKVQEISKTLAKNYLGKAARDMYHKGQQQATADAISKLGGPNKSYKKSPERKAAKRVAGIDRATRRIAKKEDAKNILTEHEKKISNSKNEVREMIDKASEEAEKNVIRVNKEFHDLMENRKKNAEERIRQLKNQAEKDIRNASVKIAIESVEKLIKNSLDKSKLDKIYTSSIEETKLALKKKSS